MKDNFVICIESLHIADTGNQENVSGLDGVFICFKEACLFVVLWFCHAFVSNKLVYVCFCFLGARTVW